MNFTQLLSFGLGIGLALSYGWSVRHFAQPHLAIALGLAIAALVYVGLAIAGRGSLNWIAIEGVGLLLFGLIASLGIRYATGWLAAGWAAHSLWDIGLHQWGAGSTFTPHWYPPLCVGFDLAVATMLLFTNIAEPHAEQRPVSAPKD